METRINRTLITILLIFITIIMTACGNMSCLINNHTWVEANYQTPKTCTVCGKTDGEPLPADYETKNININTIEIGKEYGYTTSCYADTSQKTNAFVQFNRYDIVESLEDYEPMDGYEWRIVDIEICFPEKNTYIYDVVPSAIYDCYYQMGKVTDESNGNTYAVNYNGTNYENCMYVKSTNWIYNDDNMIFEWTAAFRVPIGYDGTIIAIYDYINTYDGKTYYADVIDENSLVFRLN